MTEIIEKSLADLDFASLTRRHLRRPGRRLGLRQLRDRLVSAFLQPQDADIKSRKLGISAILLPGLIVAARSIVDHTGLRDTAINSILVSPSATASSNGASFGWFSPLCISAILLAVLIVAAPWIVAHTGLRNRAMNAILASPSVTASSDSASFGWFSPLSVWGLHLNSTNNHVDVRVEEIASERSPLQLAMDGCITKDFASAFPRSTPIW